MSYQAMKTRGGNVNAYTWGKKPIWKGCILYDSNYIAFWKTYSYGIFPNTECTMLRLNHNVSYGLLVFMMCQCGFINYSKCSTRVGCVDNAVGSVSTWAGSMWKISVPSSQSYCEAWTAFEMLSLNKIFRQYSNWDHLAYDKAKGPAFSDVWAESYPDIYWPLLHSSSSSWHQWPVSCFWSLLCIQVIVVIITIALWILSLCSRHFTYLILTPTLWRKHN